MADAETTWWWCLTHSRAEEGVSSPAEERLGPYPSKEAAEGWRDRHEGREDTWDDADEAWDSGTGRGRPTGEASGQTPA